MQSYTIMVDTNCDLPQEFINQHGIEVMSMPFQLDGEAHEGGRWQEISDKEYYDALRSGSVASTTLINPDAFTQVFTEYASQGKSLLLIVLSRGLSGTYQNAEIALADVREKHKNCEIYVVDSINAAGGCGLVAHLAVKKRTEGLFAGDTAKWLDEHKNRCISLFTVDDLMYLHRGGRLSKLSAVAGSIIGIKPLLNVAPDGTLKLKNKVRGRKAALDTLVSQLKQSLLPETALDTVIISHSDCLEDAELLAENVKNTVTIRNIEIVMMSPVIGAHVGPGTIALFFEADMTRTEYERRFYSGA